MTDTTVTAVLSASISAVFAVIGTVITTGIKYENRLTALEVGQKAQDTNQQERHDELKERLRRIEMKLDQRNAISH